MGKFRVAAVFSDNMVLQREKNIKIFGWGTDGEKVTVRLKEKTVETIVHNGKWMTEFPPMEAGTGYTMELICGADTVRFQNIAIGEVWLAGGQSNMEFELRNCIGGKEILEQEPDPNIRFYYTPKNAYKDEKFYQDEEASHWEEFGQEGTKYWSAVGYFFARKVAQEMKVPVGIIGCNWGGTSASVWMTRESLSEDKDISEILKAYDMGIAGKSVEEQKKEFKDYMDYYTVWSEKCGKMYEENPDTEWDDVIRICGENRYPGPMNCFNQIRPCGLHECMLERVMPYSLRGFIYYQGEDDEIHPKIYYKLLTRLIRQWREEWEDLSLPFLIVQLPMFTYKDTKDTKSWCYLREAQMKTYQTIKNTGIAVILDCGQFHEIHPKNKQPVGERLALQALYQVYHKVDKKEAFGPMFAYCEYEKNGLRICLNHAEDGLLVKGELCGFEIAGADKTYVTAEARIEGNTIYLTADSVLEPKYARYCWTNFGPVSVFGTNGLPLAPFRTSEQDD